MKNNKKKDKNIFTNPLVLTLSALLCCALWGSATPAIKTASPLLIPESNAGVPSTLLFAGIRFFMAGIITIVIYSIARKRLVVFKRENLPRVLTVASLQTVIQYIFFYIGVANTTSVKGAIASGSSAFFCVLTASLIFKQEKLNAKKIIACIIGFCGIVIINLNGFDLTMNFLGDGFVIISTLVYSFSSVFIKKFSKYEDPVVISGYQFIFGGAFLTLLGVVLGGKISLGDTKGVVIFVYLMFLSAIAYALWGVLLKHNPVSRVTVFSFTTPVFGTIISLLVMDEASGVGAINLAITLILVSVGILLLNYQPKKKL